MNLLSLIHIANASQRWCPQMLYPSSKSYIARVAGEIANSYSACAHSWNFPNCTRNFALEHTSEFKYNRA